MPNHITNTISISLKEGTDADEFLKKLRGTGEEDIIDFNAIIPPPDNMFSGNLGADEREQCAREGIPNWYDWQVENWGTKWNAYDQNCNFDAKYGVLDIKFDTAWSPPVPIIEALREWDEIECLSGSWLEEGHQSAGVF